MDEQLRYARHYALPEVGRDGQARLKAAKILVVGCGGLGSPIAYYLAAAGVGTLGMADFDSVELSNLHRQILHFTDDVGRTKLESAQNKVRALNPHVKFVAHNVKIDASNALEIFGNYDLIIDASDNFATRYLVNDTCVILRKPHIYGSIYRFEGMVSVFAPHLLGPCYRCWFPTPPPKGATKNCAEGGVLGVACGIIGTLQANEAIKWILGEGRPLLGRVVKFDALEMDYKELRIEKNSDCPACGTNAKPAELVCETSCVKEIAMSDDMSVESVNKLKKEDFVLIDVRTPDEYAICHIDGATLVPMNELPSRLEEIPKDKLVVMHCHHGGRSRRAVAFLKSQGYTDVKNMDGGIDQWALSVDPSVARY